MKTVTQIKKSKAYLQNNQAKIINALYLFKIIALTAVLLGEFISTWNDFLHILFARASFLNHSVVASLIEKRRLTLAKKMEMLKCYLWKI